MGFVADKSQLAKNRYNSIVEASRTQAYLDLFKVLKDQPYYTGGESFEREDEKCCSIGFRFNDIFLGS
jgi:hypothetical protein